jgi:alpha-tubulin suppressor-like RCC1 family protein
MLPRTARLPFPVAPTAVALLLAIACSDQPLPTGPTAPGRPGFDIADASRNYKPGFYWLPPMVQQPAYSGIFDAALSPTVEICELVADVCGPVLATYSTTTGSGGELVRLDVDEQHFHVNWHTNEFDLSATKLYRVSVRAGIYETLLGYADVQPVSNGSGLKKVDTDEYIGLVDGRTLPIKFRIETGIVGNVEVQPLEAEVEPGDTQQFSAILHDLHGNVMSADVTWASSDGAVATVDQTGLATAITEGEATITATSERMSGSATLTVDRIVASVEVQPLEAEVEPGATQQFVAILRDRHGNVMTADVTWASSDAAVATVNQTGLATAIDDGEATITATSEGVSGSATLTVEGGVVVVSAGRGHACALNPDGRAFCWGINDQGQLGIGVLGNRISPVAVSGGLTFAAIASGDFHTCGITLLGQAYCWGNNQSGELGDASLVRRLTPVAVSGGLSFVSISTGARNSCALTAGNQAYCWGEGGFGALGNGSSTRATTPQLVSGGHAFASISSGQQFTCGVTTAGVGYCWGLGTLGRLGNGSTSNRFTPVAVAGGLTFTSIRAGDIHACGVTTSGQGYCWGFGQNGRLGNGTTTNSSTPQPVSGGLVFAEISAGGVHTCGVTTTGQGYCWGGNADGSLGTGSGSSRSTPGAVIGGLTWASISASGLIGVFGSESSTPFAFTCGVSVAGQTYCWGSGFHGQLGNGSTLNRGSPTPVAAFP